MLHSRQPNSPVIIHTEGRVVAELFSALSFPTREWGKEEGFCKVGVNRARKLEAGRRSLAFRHLTRCGGYRVLCPLLCSAVENEIDTYGAKELELEPPVAKD